MLSGCHVGLRIPTERNDNKQEILVLAGIVDTSGWLSGEVLGFGRGELLDMLNDTR